MGDEIETRYRRGKRGLKVSKFSESYSFLFTSTFKIPKKQKSSPEKKQRLVKFNRKERIYIFSRKQIIVL